MKQFGIIRNTEKTESGEAAVSLLSYLEKRGAKGWISDSGADLPSECECALVLGGDGTLLRAAKVVLDRQLPLLGINLGNLGYLAEVEKSHMLLAAERLLSDNYLLERRMMLTGRVLRGRERCAEQTDFALNEVVLGRKGPLRNFRIFNYVNDAFLNSYSADGVILSTATGSTGYNLSVGGPIVSPDAEVILMTPLAAHSLISRSILFSGGDVIRVEVGEGSNGFVKGIASVRFDGGGEVLLDTGDAIEVRRAEQYTNIIKLRKVSFLDVLRRKMADA